MNLSFRYLYSGISISNNEIKHILEKWVEFLVWNLVDSNEIS